MYDENIKLRIGLAPWPKMRPECIGRIHDPHCDPGYELQILDILFTLLNVQYEIKYANEFGCGFRSDNGSWTGLMKLLLDGDVDIVGNLCKLEPDRRNQSWLKYSRPVLQDRQGFLITVPDKLHVFFITAPFDPVVWFLVFLSLCIFILVFALTYAIHTSKMINIEVLLEGICATLNILSGTEKVPLNITWFYFQCFCGFLTISYSTFITSVLLTPVGRPFNDHYELAEQLFRGNYRLLDFKHPRSIVCYDEITCSRIKFAVDKYGFRHFQQPSGVEGTNLLLQQLFSKEEKLVLVKGVFGLKFYLSSFAERNRLWLITDEFSSDEWSVYFYRSDFRFSQQFDQALITMSGGVEGIVEKYFGLSHQVVQARNIKEKISKRIKYNFDLVSGPLKAYGIGVSVSFAIFAIELGLKRLNRKTFNVLF